MMKWISFILLLPLFVSQGPPQVFAQEVAVENIHEQRVVNPKSKVRKQRLEAYFAAFVAWSDFHCQLTADQKSKLQNIIAKWSLKPPIKMAVPDGEINRNHFDDFRTDVLPLRFVDLLGAAREFFNDGFEADFLEILDSDQIVKYQNAITKRNQDLHEIFLQRVIGKINRQLTLTAKEKQQLKQIFPEHLPLLENGLYSFKPLKRYVNEKSLYTILTQPPMVLSRNQWGLLQQIKKEQDREGFKNLGKSIRFEASTGVTEWHEIINTEAHYFQEELKLILMKKAQECFLGEQLSSQQLHYLKTARKGAALSSVREWKKNAFASAAQYERHAVVINGNGVMVPASFVFYIRGADGDQIDQHPIWINAISKIRNSLQVGGRAKSSEFTIKYAIALLDQELWFTPRQLQIVRELYRNAYLADELLYDGDQYELCLLASIIYSNRQGELESLLSQEQIRAFKTLKNQYEIHDEMQGAFLRFFKSDR